MGRPMTPLLSLILVEIDRACISVLETTSHSYKLRGAWTKGLAHTWHLVHGSPPPPPHARRPTPPSSLPFLRFQAVSPLKLRPRRALRGRFGRSSSSKSFCSADVTTWRISWHRICPERRATSSAVQPSASGSCASAPSTSRPGALLHLSAWPTAG